MKPNNMTVFELFERQQRYVVPLFQRPYVWTLEGQWKPLWEDISQKAEEIINNQRNDHQETSNHFMGAIVLSPIKTSGLQVTAKSIIDGQQRLTTLQIILITLRDFMKEIGATDLVSTIELHTINKCKMEQEVEKYKVWPTNADRREYVSIFNAGSPEKLKDEYPPVRKKYHHDPEPLPVLLQAYFFFYDSIKAFVNTDNNDDGQLTEEDQRDRLSALVEAFKRHLEIVTIDLDETDNPQAIFETLNFRGVMLLPSDLIRNFVFLEAARQKYNVEDLYHHYWLDYDQNLPDGRVNFWKALESQGRMQRPRMELFIFHYLVFQTEKEVPLSELYKVFRAWWSSKQHDVEYELIQLQKYSLIFQKIIQPDSETRAGIVMRRLQLLEVSTVYPLLLYLFGLGTEILPPDELEGMLVDIESYLVRRQVCGLNTKNYNYTFLSLFKHLKKSEKLNRIALRNFLNGLTGDSVRWPDDREFATAWLSRPVYQQMGSRCRLVLDALDVQMRSSKQEGAYADLSRLSIEHLMPQSWQANYPLPDGLSPEKKLELESNRANLVHTFGNLTLLTLALNDSIQNGPFEKKHAEITRQSILRLNADLLNLPQPLKWDEESILTRGQKLFKLAVQIWPHP